MRQHTCLPAMVGFVRKHVAQHFQPRWPGRCPSVSDKRFDPAITSAESVLQHCRATECALSQCRAGLTRCALRAIELSRNFQMRGRKPDSLAADIVHMREDRGNAANSPRRLGCPSGWIKMFDKHLVDTVVYEKKLGGRFLNWRSTNLVIRLHVFNHTVTRHHCPLLLANNRRNWSMLRFHLLAIRFRAGSIDFLPQCWRTAHLFGDKHNSRKDLLAPS